jgi:hypothetical protein
LPRILPESQIAKDTQSAHALWLMAEDAPLLFVLESS